jgi:DNA-binding Lrp family transcriptional regulator
VILGFWTELSPTALGLSLQAYIDVKLQPGVSMDNFEKTLKKLPGIRDATSITGAFDARLRIDCKDTVQLGSFIEQLRVHAGVQETSCYVITRQLCVRPDELAKVCS